MTATSGMGPAVPGTMSAAGMGETVAEPARSAAVAELPPAAATAETVTAGETVPVEPVSVQPVSVQAVSVKPAATPTAVPAAEAEIDVTRRIGIAGIAVDPRRITIVIARRRVAIGISRRI